MPLLFIALYTFRGICSLTHLSASFINQLYDDKYWAVGMVSLSEIEGMLESLQWLDHYGALTQSPLHLAHTNTAFSQLLVWQENNYTMSTANYTSLYNSTVEVLCLIGQKVNLL